MSIRFVRVAAVCISTMIAIPTLAYAEPGDMMHLTIDTDAQLSSAPGDKPPVIVKRDVCMSKDHDARELAKLSQRDEICTFSGYRQIVDQDSNHAKFRETCTGPMQVTGTANFSVDPGSIHGQIHAEGKLNGRAVAVDTTVDAAVTGRCDYRPMHTSP